VASGRGPEEKEIFAAPRGTAATSNCIGQSRPRARVTGAFHRPTSDVVADVRELAMEGMEKDDSLITGSSETPEPDEGCFNTCYYVGYSWEHDHSGGTE